MDWLREQPRLMSLELQPTIELIELPIELIELELMKTAGAELRMNPNQQEQQHSKRQQTVMPSQSQQLRHYYSLCCCLILLLTMMRSPQWKRRKQKCEEASWPGTMPHSILAKQTRHLRFESFVKEIELKEIEIEIDLDREFELELELELELD